jgi:hypothetical protein
VKKEKDKKTYGWQQVIQNVLNNPAATVKHRSEPYYVCMNHRSNQALSSQENQANLEYQVQYLRKQRDLCTAVGDYHSLLHSPSAYTQSSNLN